MSPLDAHRDQLVRRITELGSCAIAFSGGVDSAVVAKAAHVALGDQAVAVTGHSPSLAAGELEQAAEVARQIGIRHEVLETSEFQLAEYRRNNPDRCYHCKTELYLRVDQIKARLGVTNVVNGANADDLGDWRPGMRAAAEHDVHSPLAECGIGKSMVRELARHWKLTVWDKPAMPCLASRVVYGQEVTPERLAMLDGAEQLLRKHGISTVRVRYHQGDLARLEVPLNELPRLSGEPLRGELVAKLRALGFRTVTLDLEGFRSGNLNQLVSLEPWSDGTPGSNP